MDNGTLRQLQLAELEILKEIDRLCRINELKYYLIGGTLLGAVRHNGFIPWDDDIDIVMPRKDYEKFTNVCPSQLDDKYFLQTYTSDREYWLPFSKLRKNGTIFLEEQSKNIGAHHGIFVDIFPLDYSPRQMSISIKFKGKLSSFMRGLVYAKLGLCGSAYSKRSMRYRIGLALTKHISANRLLDYQQRLVSFSIKGEKCRYYTNYGSQYGIRKQTIEIAKYHPPKRLFFEGYEFNVPNEYTYILKRIFGDDYMQLPPIEKQITHMPLIISFGYESPNECNDM